MSTLAPPANRVEDPSAELAAALSSGELKAAASCFARDACLLTADATAIRGRDDTRTFLAQLVAIIATAEVQHRAALVSGEIAIAEEHWTTHFLRSGEPSYFRAVPSTSVLRRIEGRWKLQIAAPWGWGAAAGAPAG